MRAPLSKVLSHALVVGFALATSETAWALPKTRRVLSRAAVVRCALEPPVNRVGDRAMNGPHAFRLNAGLGNNPINRDF